MSDSAERWARKRSKMDSENDVLPNSAGCRIDEAVVLAGARHPASRAFDRPQQHELAGIPHRQRPQQQLVHEAEDGRVGADAKRERQHRDGAEAGALHELTEGKLEVVHGSLDGMPSARVGSSTRTLPF